ncbi:MAG: bifunctional glutamine-synthetase adenylyltransferase/deadenyltransferase [Micrococcales bacterium 73-15]|uniref:bifunctional [glutamine synthetase] adenylyltransferase/[glutamine synthetase]-adenylyl-L-tyrosine phosphorylase n=1 Tax=Salana multivorans TaxID=120377 RepID=UPI0009595327|nr:bifunctional [glutamine synthetase] adenylyltransferase/[glutamine synthetase]-adenylyl-L-tyrosine phosphorylase [Salana multivorans]OJX93380.1 MAG: bifunctional glutamine-synthetase adenylyltransferase/deadenyltransferase [Micrococcales bacterium 73-15]
MTRRPSPTTRLLRSGFHELARAEAILAGDWLQPVLADDDAAGLLAALGESADPDLALLALDRIHDRADEDVRRALVAVLGDGGGPRERLLAVLGASEALGDALVSHPGDLAVVTGVVAGDHVSTDAPDDADDVRGRLLRAVGADPGAPGPRASVEAATARMRRAYRRELLRIAAADLTQPDPLAGFSWVAAALADLAAAALEAALAIARTEVPDSDSVRLAVLGMGKTGGRELNYVSDVDVVYVAEPALDADGEPVASEQQVVRVGTQLASALARACSGPGVEPALWEVDAALRPEGKNGPLVRTLASHVAYYERWAKTWEFQALLKARPVAGDRELGELYVETLRPLVWTAVQRERFVEDAQAMRRRVEAHIPRKDADRELKLGTGGLRDVEFTVQLLQLVHGRLAPGIRSRTTLEALDALAAEGFVGRGEAERLAADYRFLRLMEHRIQLQRLRRTHLVPTAEQDLVRVARSMRPPGADGAGGGEATGETGDLVVDLLARWQRTRRDVRGLHEDLFYRPLLPATARLSAEDAALSPEAAYARLAALGYRSPEQALAHITALTEGVSRRAAIQRHLLPVLLGWFTQGADPDAGLLAFRTLSEEVGGSHWYLKLLRDSGVAARNLARVLSSSRYAADALRRSPESVRWLAEDGDLRPRSVAALDAEMDAVLRRREGDPAAGATFVRYLRRRELARTAVSDVLTNLEADLTPGISSAADAALRGALRIATEQVGAEQGYGDEPPTRQLVVAMGRLGGHELGYASDADVMFVHDPLPGADPVRAQQFALAVAQRVGQLLGQTGPEPALRVDADLRPEGRSGPLTRTLASYEEYYDRWSAPWERQALLRARPVAGDEGLAIAFLELVDPLRYAGGGLSESELREYRRIKARVERERMPRGVTPTRHLKLGPGGLADVEWTVQLLQLLHAHDVPALRTPSTLAALDAAASAGLLAATDAELLSRAWRSSSRTRDAIVLVTGRTSGTKVDVLPAEHRELTGTAALLGYVPVSGAALEDDYLRTARRARMVVDRVFYGE